MLLVRACSNKFLPYKFQSKLGWRYFPRPCFIDGAYDPMFCAFDAAVVLTVESRLTCAVARSPVQMPACTRTPENSAATHVMRGIPAFARHVAASAVHKTLAPLFELLHLLAIPQSGRLSKQVDFCLLTIHVWNCSSLHVLSCYFTAIWSIVNWGGTKCTIKDRQEKTSSSKSIRWSFCATARDTPPFTPNFSGVGIVHISWSSWFFVNFIYCLNALPSCLKSCFLYYSCSYCLIEDLKKLRIRCWSKSCGK